MSIHTSANVSAFRQMELGYRLAAYAAEMMLVARHVAGIVARARIRTYNGMQRLRCPMPVIENSLSSMQARSRNGSRNGVTVLLNEHTYLDLQRKKGVSRPGITKHEADKERESWKHRVKDRECLECHVLRPYPPRTTLAQLQMLGYMSCVGFWGIQPFARPAW